MEPTLYTKKQLKEKGLTAAQIKALVPAGTIKSGGRGRPSFGYALPATTESVAA